MKLIQQFTYDNSMRGGETHRNRKPTRDAASGGPAVRTRVASFEGTGYVAEREGDALIVYLVGTQSIPTTTTGDARSPFDRAVAAKGEAIQKRHEAHRAADAWGSR